VTNPNATEALFRLLLYRGDPGGGGVPVLLGATAPVRLAVHGMKQFGLGELRALGAGGESDYRVEVETLAGGPLVPFAAIRREVTGDASLALAGRIDLPRQHLLGALRKRGLAGSDWLSQLVLFNPAGEPMALTVRLVGLGVAAEQPAAAQIVLAPGAVRRIVDPFAELWGLTGGAGVVVVESLGVAGRFPVAQLETFDQGRSSGGVPLRYGQIVAPRGDADAAVAGQRQLLTGLRQDADFRTVLWLYSPAAGALVDLVYRSPGGEELGRLTGVAVGAGTRQVAPGRHPLPAGGPPAGAAGWFTLEVQVVAGSVLAGAQVVDARTSDPSFVAGETR
jgi:hypothetical protein